MQLVCVKFRFSEAPPPPKNSEKTQNEGGGGAFQKGKAGVVYNMGVSDLGFQKGVGAIVNIFLKSVDSGLNQG